MVAMVTGATRPYDVVQSLWIGDRLGAMERLAIQSFLDHGHEFHLYCYDGVDGVPAGTTVRNGRDILPADRIFAYSEGFAKDSPAAFSNFFRYKLLLERGGWWVDTDVVCLKPFTFEVDRLIASERLDPPQGYIASTSVLKAPAGDALMAWLWDLCRTIDTRDVRFGQLGPRLLQKGIDALDLGRLVESPARFSPVPFFEWRRLIDDESLVPGPDTYAVHLWHQMWSANAIDDNSVFSSRCLYQRLRDRHRR
jgi:hypothetical protein